MAPRPIWTGYLKLSLVACAVALYPATSTRERVHFHVLNRKTGHRIHNVIADAETGKPVPDEDQVKGYEIEKGRYVLVEDEELDAVALESTHTVDIEMFVPRDEIDDIYLDGSYYMVPLDAVSADAFAVTREAMGKEGVVGIGRVVMYRRERLLMLQPRGKGMLATALRYRDEIRDAKPYLSAIPKEKITGDMLAIAKEVVAGKTGHFDPDQFEDRYEKALRALIRAKDAGKPLPQAPEPPRSKVIDLMDALRRSVKGEEGRGVTARRRAGATARGRKRAGSHRRLGRAG
jgi:DNA end-binding protein Ku